MSNYPHRAYISRLQRVFDNPIHIFAAIIYKAH